MAFQGMFRRHLTFVVVKTIYLTAKDTLEVGTVIDLEKHNVKMVQSMRSYFLKIAHHRSDPSDDDFMKWQYEFERFLLDRLKPRTFEDTDAIDSLIARGRRDD